MEGKTVIITGANRGIGLETARELAKRKARVILACRNTDRAENAAADIQESSGNTNVVVRHLDLSSLESVRQFASGIVATETRLDVLIHNAAVFPPPGRHITKDNMELQFQTNYFGPFLLNHLLLDLLKQSAPSRIVVLSSVSHFFGGLDFDNLNCEKYERNHAFIYCSTKLANILFAKELSRRLKGTGVTVNAAHPGTVRTSIFSDSRGLIKCLLPIFHHCAKSTHSGAKTPIYLATSEEVENVSGKYFANCRESPTSLAARNNRLAAKLWDISEILTGIKSDLNL